MTGDDGGTRRTVFRKAKSTAVRFRGHAARRLGIDTRALAAFRAAIGLTVLVDLVARSRDFVAFYTDEGVLPPSYLSSDPVSSLSVHFVSGDVRFQAFLFVATGLAALLLVVGYRTLPSTVVLFALVTSLQEYNPYVLNSGDLMLRWYLFFGIFLPLGARWSVDSLRDGRTDPGRVKNIATASALLYAVMIYIVNGLSKLRSDAWTSGEAVVNVLNTDKYTVLLGNHLGEFTELLVFVNWAWLALLNTDKYTVLLGNHVGGFTELLVFVNWAWLALLLGSFLLVLLTGWLRLLLATAFIAAHTGMFLTMQLGVFPLVAVSVLLLFLPPFFWDRVEGSMRRFEVGDEPARHFRGLLWTRFEPVTPERVRNVLARGAFFFVGVVLLTSLVWQFDYAGYADVPEEIEDIAEPVRESWTLFAPNPPSQDDWYLAPATLKSGETVDLLHLTDEELDRPPDAGGSYPNARWRKYLTHSTFEEDDERVRRFAEFLCERGEEHYDSSPVNVTVYDVWQPDPIEDPGKTSKEEVVSHECS